MRGVSVFDRLPDGRPVLAVRLRAGDIGATVLTYGAILHSVRLAGHEGSLTTGSDRLSDYQGSMRYHGALIGPVANRLGGATAPVAGRQLRLEANEAGRTTLHSGSTGCHAQLWTLAQATETSVTLTLDLADGTGGFPGNRRIGAQYDLLAPGTLRLTLSATTDAPTLMNLANHSYWHLGGGPGFAGHLLAIAADRMLRVDEALVPTGQIDPVAGTDLDFRQPRALRPGAPPLDTCFCLSDAPQPLRDVLTLAAPGGPRMTLATTAPALQVYDGRDATPAYAGLAIEAQGWPDAPNHPGFPPITLVPGQTFAQTTEWRLSR